MKTYQFFDLFYKGLVLTITGTIWVLKRPKIFLYVFVAFVTIKSVMWVNDARHEIYFFQEACDGKGMITVSEEFGKKWAKPCPEEFKTKPSIDQPKNPAFLIPEAKADDQLDALKSQMGEWEDYSTSLPDHQYQFGEMLMQSIDQHHEKWRVYDLDALAKAVARHETQDCGLNYGSSAVNNCFGIRECHYGHCHGFKRYNHPAESYGDFKRIWMTYYKNFPTINEANVWTGEDRAREWLNNVTLFYSAS